jgi:hypothetical protein
MAQLPVLYALLRDWKTHRARAAELKADWPFEAEPQAVYDRFIQVAKANQVTAICEGQGGYGLIDQALEAARQ